MGYKNTTSLTLVIPDLHCPFQHPDAFDFLSSIKQSLKPDIVVCLGDEMDFHSISKWPHDPDGYAAGQEYAKGVEALIPLYKLFSKVKVCTSNHTIRPFKKAFENGIPQAMLPSYQTLLRSPEGWEWDHSHIIDGVRYIHGDGRSGQYAHMAHMRGYKQSTVIGHIHSFAGVNYEGGYFGMNAGCLIDKDSYAFKYARGFSVPVNLGCGFVEEGKRAHFIPMHTDKNNRWIGKLGL